MGVSAARRSRRRSAHEMPRNCQCPSLEPPVAEAVDVQDTAARRTRASMGLLRGWWGMPLASGARWALVIVFSLAALEKIVSFAPRAQHGTRLARWRVAASAFDVPPVDLSPCRPGSDCSPKRTAAMGRSHVRWSHRHLHNCSLAGPPIPIGRLSLPLQIPRNRGPAATHHSPLLAT